jgi:hypothetical protein
MKVPVETVKLALGAVLIFVVTTAAGTGVRLAALWPGAATPTTAAGLPPYLVASLGALPTAGVNGAITDPNAMAPIAGVPGAQVANRVEFAQIAGILVRMRPAEAAVLMNHLEDEHCVAILASMSVRDCAAILQALPPDRRAALQEQLFGALAESGS